MIARLFRRLFYGGSSSLRNYEASCIDCLRTRLSAEARSILDSQLEAIELIQRFSDDKLVTFHLKKGRGEAFALFPNQSPELYVAKMDIRQNEGKAMTCELVFHRGRLSSLEFNCPPRNMEPHTTDCDKLEIFENLMSSPKSSSCADEPDVQGKMLDTIRSRIAISDVIAPASQTEREEFLKRLSVIVPDDYRALLIDTNGFVAGVWRFLGTRGRNIVLPDRTYYVVAERADAQAALCFRESERRPLVIFYDEINDDEQPAGDRFVESLLRVVQK